MEFILSTVAGDQELIRKQIIPGQHQDLGTILRAQIKILQIFRASLDDCFWV